jgi:hypothetical protein
MNKLWIFVLLFFSLCVDAAPKNSWEKKLEKAGFEGLGASTLDLKRILGQPGLSSQRDELEVLRYCKTGLVKDRFISFFFEKDKFVWAKYEEIILADGMCWEFWPRIDWKEASASKQYSFNTEEFHIDGLNIIQITDKDVSECHSGSSQKLVLSGVIGPDSTFAIETLLRQMEPCKNIEGKVKLPIIVSLRSGGGLLEHGYLLGELLRKYEIMTLVENEEICASSCAVAYLGGLDRVVEDKGTILFHSPYITGENDLGQKISDCNVGKKALQNLNKYYKKMTSEEVGERIYERTMWYCSNEDGWTVTGGSAAELYGIATQK